MDTAEKEFLDTTEEFEKQKPVREFILMVKELLETTLQIDDEEE